MDGRGVYGDFIRAGAYYSSSVVQGANSAARGERDCELGGYPADRFQEGGSAVARGGDIQDDQFIGAFGVVTSRQSDGIASVAQANKIHAFDDASPVGIEAGNDPMSEGHATSLRKFCSNRAPAGPLFSGWNWTALMLWLSRTAMNSEPCVQVATALAFPSPAIAA